MDGILSNTFLSRIFYMIIQPLLKVHSNWIRKTYNRLEGVEAEESEAKVIMAWQK